MPNTPPNETNALSTQRAELESDFALRVVKQLSDAGHVAMWAGGCVRDRLRGVIPSDYDVATSATPQQVRAIFGNRRTLAIGEQFGVVVVLGRSTTKHATIQHQVEVATFRKDAQYEDGRHPTSVEFSSPEEDAARRDFTINGIFFDPVEQLVIDFVGGQRDLELRLLRAIGNPSDRFDEDKLRMLRAVRFASTLDLTLDPDTHSAIAARPHELALVSAERIATELRKICENEHRARGIALLRETGQLEVVFPETASLVFERKWPQTMTAIRRSVVADFSVCLALLFRSVTDDRGLAISHFMTAARRQKLTKRETRLAVWLMTHETAIQNAERGFWPDVQRLLICPDIDYLLQFVSAICWAMSGIESTGVKFCRHRLKLPTHEFNPPPLISGSDLRDHGIPRGEIYRTILDAVRNAQLLGTCSTPKQALAIADKIIDA